MRIVLWDHYGAGMGGIEKLIVTLARDFSGSHEVVVICRGEGTIHRALTELKTGYTHVDPSHARLDRHISCDDLLIDFGTYDEQRAMSTVNPRLLLWRVFPSVGCKGRLATYLARLTFAALDRTKSLAFMDSVCHETACHELHSSFRRTIVPLPIILRGRKYLARKSREVIRITYVGRGSRIWKVKPVKKLVSDLRVLTDHRFEVHVFTDTTDLFEAELQGLQGGNVIVEYHRGVVMEALSRKLLGLSDLHYSMGTACLEGAVLGIPTIIADASYEDFPDDYRYRWLVDDIENYAGVFLGHAAPRGHELKTIIGVLGDQDGLQRLSELTYDAVVANFSSERIAHTIETLEPQARIRDVLKFMPSYWLSGGPLARVLGKRPCIHE